MAKSINVAFFGDSICFGQCVAVHHGWVVKISRRLEDVAIENNLELTVTNAGVNGNTTRLALERMVYDVLSHDIDILIIQFGMNDCNYWLTDKGHPRVSKKGFKANLHEIIDRANCFRVKKLFLNSNHPTSRVDIMPMTQWTYQESNEQYNSITREVAKSRVDVIFTDIEKIIMNHDFDGPYKINVSDMVLDDGIHLSKLGHEIYFRIMFPKINQALLEVIND